jgi:hypothetical protein
LAVYGRALNLITGQREIITLVSPEIGDGPLNVVVGDGFAHLAGVQAGAPVYCDPERLAFGASMEIRLESADVWEPRPNWAALRTRQAGIEASLAPLEALCLEQDPDNPLLSLLGAPAPGAGRSALLRERFRNAGLELQAGWKGDQGALNAGAGAIAGLGDGLTPAGDDFLVGVMLWSWLAHRAPERFCEAVVRAAGLRTTTLSAAFLRAAARGQCSAAWHGLLEALAWGESQMACRQSTSGVPGQVQGAGCSKVVARLSLRGAATAKELPTLSRAPWGLLRCARSDSWQGALQQPLVQGAQRAGASQRVLGAAWEVLAHGASSGLDALIGFLYVSSRRKGGSV